MSRRHDDHDDAHRDDHDVEDEPRRPHADNDHRLRHPLWLIVPVVVITLIAIAINRIEPAAPGAFYTPPDPLTAGDAGTIIRSEPLRACRRAPRAGGSCTCRPIRWATPSR